MNSNTAKNSRRQFLMYTGLLLGGGLLVSACGGPSHSADTSLPEQTPTDREPQDDGTFCRDAGAKTNYTNPGHKHISLNLSLEQMSLAAEGDYFLLGGSHTHSFSLNNADFVALHSGHTIQKEDNEGHGHIISISC